MRKHNWKRTLFYVRRGLIRWVVLFAVGLGSLTLAVQLMENPDSRFVLEAALAFFAVLWVGSKFYEKGEKE